MGNKIAFAGPLCECGCGEPATWHKRKKQWNRFINQHHNRTKEAKERLAKRNRERVWSDESREKCRQAALAQTPYERTPEQREAIRQRQLGRKAPWLAEFNRSRDMSGKRNPNYKHGKTRNNRCVDCGDRIYFGFTRCKSCANSGARNPRYIDGATALRLRIRSLKEYVEWKSTALEMSNGCNICGASSALHVHHEIMFSKLFREFTEEYPLFWSVNDDNVLIMLARSWGKFWDVGNATVLCQECHDVIHGRGNNHE